MLHRGYYKKNCPDIGSQYYIPQQQGGKIAVFKGVFGCHMHFYKLF